METIKAFWRLVRGTNLFFIMLTQLLVWFYLVVPPYRYYGIEDRLVLGLPEVLLLVIATVLIAAAGNVINDYFDVRIDYINKPSRIVIGKYFNRRTAIILHTTLNIIASLIGIYVGYRTGNFRLGFIFLFCAGLLWFYSTSFKKMFLIGNLLVAFLSALVVFLIPLFEMSLRDLNDGIMQLAARDVIRPLSVYGGFAFLISLIREIVKDLEDMEGDAAYGCQTMPVIAGIRATKLFVSFLSLILIGGLSVIQYLYLSKNAYITFIYVLILLQIPALFAIYFLWKADGPEKYQILSRLIKGIMFVGIVSIGIIYYLW